MANPYLTEGRNCLMQSVAAGQGPMTARALFLLLLTTDVLCLRHRALVVPMACPPSRSVAPSARFRGNVFRKSGRDTSVTSPLPAHAKSPERGPQAARLAQQHACGGDPRVGKGGVWPSSHAHEGAVPSDWSATDNGALGSIQSVAELQAAIACANERERLLVLKFFSPRCTTCRAIAPKVARAARKLRTDVDFYEVDTHAAEAFCKQCTVKSVPVAHVYSRGKLTEKAIIEPNLWAAFLSRLDALVSEASMKFLP